MKIKIRIKLITTKTEIINQQKQNEITKSIYKATCGKNDNKRKSKQRGWRQLFH